MQERDAATIVAIMCEADGGCSTCASSLVSDFIRAFPEREMTARRVYKKHFDYELEEED